MVIPSYLHALRIARDGPNVRPGGEDTYDSTVHDVHGSARRNILACLAERDG